MITAQASLKSEEHPPRLNHGPDVIEVLKNSKMYRDYQRAFSTVTGLPVSLHPVAVWQLPHRGQLGENPFCAMLAQSSHACAACLRLQQELCESATRQPKTVTCPHGLCETAVPVQGGDKLVGFLKTGQMFRHKPTEAQLDGTAKLLAAWGLKIAPDELKATYLASPVFSSKQIKLAAQLLRIFAEHLSMVGDEMMLQQQPAENAVIARAKAFIQEHHQEGLSLGRVARAVNISGFHLCKLFKKRTRLNFTGYLSRVRIEKAKNLLLNRNLRVREIALQVGFQTVVHFNRTFKKLLGYSPTAYRHRLRIV